MLDSTVCSTFLPFSFFSLLFRLPPISTLFPYTTLFRSEWLVEESVKKSVASTRPAPRYCTHDPGHVLDRKSTRLNSSHANISYAVFCLKKKKERQAW